MCERVDRERAETRRAAGVRPEAWVDDWWLGAAVKKNGGEVIGPAMGKGEGMEAEDKSEDKEEKPDCRSGVERGVNRLGL